MSEMVKKIVISIISLTVLTVMVSQIKKFDFTNFIDFSLSRVDRDRIVLKIGKSHKSIKVDKIRKIA